MTLINVGKIKVGGDSPISVQSMTNTLTTDIKRTINQLQLGSVVHERKK